MGWNFWSIVVLMVLYYVYDINIDDLILFLILGKLLQAYRGSWELTWTLEFVNIRFYYRFNIFLDKIPANTFCN